MNRKINEQPGIPKRPSKMPRLGGLFLIIFIAPALFVLGFGANKMHRSTPEKTDMARIVSKESVEVATQPDETVFIYADYFTIARKDGFYRVEDSHGNEIPLTLLSGQKPLTLEGSWFAEFYPAVSFLASGGEVTVYCDTTGESPGEFFIGVKVNPRSMPLLMLVFFMLGALVMAFGVWIAVRNIMARKRWFERYG